MLRARVFICLFVFISAFPAFALTGRRVFIYPQKNSISYTNKPGEGICRLSVLKTEPAQVLEETPTHMKVHFENEMRGCIGDAQIGWLPKKEMAWGEDDQTPAQVAPVQFEYAPPLAKGDKLAVPCNPLMKEPKQARPILDALKQSAAANIRSVEECEKYLDCYSKNTLYRENYPKYKPIMNLITNSFVFRKDGTDYTVDPVMFRCLIRRESEFKPQDKSHTGAVGLGQHTNVNIRHIDNRLKERNSWERQIWDRFFDHAEMTPEGREMLAQCPRTAKGEDPVFQSKYDAACPLNSLAASAIYILQIQESLKRRSKVKEISLNDQLDFHVAVGAAYNMGDGAAGSAVDTLIVKDWLPAIQRRAPPGDKSKEVANHITALRNCMEKGSIAKKPMYRKDEVTDPKTCQ